MAFRTSFCIFVFIEKDESFFDHPKIAGFSKPFLSSQNEFGPYRWQGYRSKDIQVVGMSVYREE